MTDPPAVAPVVAVLATPTPTRPRWRYAPVIDTAKAIWSGAVTSGLVTVLAAWLGSLSTQGHSALWVFGVTMAVTGLRTALRLWQDGPASQPTVGLVTNFRPEPNVIYGPQGYPRIDS